MDAMLLALEALPDQASTDSARRDRPLVDDALVALKEASRRVKEIAVLQSGKGVHNLALSPDGSLLAASSSRDSGEVVLIDMASRAIVRRLLARELRRQPAQLHTEWQGGRSAWLGRQCLAA